MGKLIIFDFDGVLADSLDAVFRMNQEAVMSIGKKITINEYCACFEGHINQKLAAMYGLDEMQKKNLIDLKATLYPRYYTTKSVRLFSFAEELVREASTLGELWIVSSSPKEYIIDILEPYELVNYFTKIVGQNSQPKGLFFKEALSEYKNSEVFFITDTTGDLKEIKKAGVDVSTIAVTWGFHSSLLLESENPTFLVDDPKQITKFISGY